jgi:hypothetical protein
MENINCIKKKVQKTDAILDNFVDYYILCTEKKY